MVIMFFIKQTKTLAILTEDLGQIALSIASLICKTETEGCTCSQGYITAKRVEGNLLACLSCDSRPQPGQEYWAVQSWHSYSTLKTRYSPN